MDRNQAIGLVLITVIMMGYFMYFGNEQQKTPPQVITDTTKVIVSPKEQAQADTAAIDTTALSKKFGSFSALARGEAKQDILSNDLLKVTLNSKGGAIESVLLKKYLTYDKQPLYLLTKETNNLNYILPTQKEGDLNLKDFYFVSTKTDSTVVYKAEIGTGKYIEQIYTLRKNDYVVHYELKLIGLDNLVKNENVKFFWNLSMQNTEKDIKQVRNESTVNYYLANEEFDYLKEASVDEENQKLETPVKWISMKEKFFSSAIIAENNFTNGAVKSRVDLNNPTEVKNVEANLNIPIGDLKSGKGNFRYYFGPNHFQTLNEVTDGFHKNVDLGWPVINWINRFVVMPVFHFLQSFIGNYGILITVLVILLKLLLFPLSWKSYLSMAKMKVLKPEIDEIKERTGGDMQKSQMETMELYRKVGINPLSGCIPVLLQMPILLAMFNFFPNAIELRQENFLWADDLSTYDAIFTWTGDIPLLSYAFGNHFSLFTFLMTISTIVYTWFNNQVSTVTGPMKTVSYVMPVVFMFVLNSFPAGLSFYYFVSNIVTIIQQVVIRKFVDEDKIKLTLEENKKKIAATPGKKSRWMSRLEEAMKAKEEEAKKKKKK